MADIILASLDDLSQLVAALPAEAQSRVVAQNIEDEEGNVTGYLLTVPEEWAAQAQALADDLPRVRRLALIAYLKEKRWRVEIGGVWVPIGGEPVQVTTVRGDERNTLHSTYSAIRDGLRPDGKAYNFADGIPRAVSNADMTAAIMAALNHVQACFDLELALTPQIEVGTITTRLAIDAAAWPSNDPVAPAA